MKQLNIMLLPIFCLNFLFFYNHQSFQWSINQSIYQYIYVTTYNLSIYISIYLSIYLLSSRDLAHPLVHLWRHPSALLSNYLSIIKTYIYLSIYIYWSIYISKSLSSRDLTLPVVHLRRHPAAPRHRHHPLHWPRHRGVIHRYTEIGWEMDWIDRVMDRYIDR